MALDFELNLIMPEDNAGIFCRSNIEATRYLIKHRLPAIADRLSQILEQEPLPLDEEQTHSIYQQLFFVDLEPDQVADILETLTLTIEDEHNSPTPGLVILAKSLYREWMELAQSKGLVGK